MSKVVNVKVKYIRPTYMDLEKWMQDPDNVYIGRAGIVFINGERFPKKPSIFHNPFKIKPSITRENVIDKYREYIKEKCKNPEFQAELEKLRGKNLGCWCAPDPCHGHVLLELLNNLQTF